MYSEDNRILIEAACAAPESDWLELTCLLRSYLYTTQLPSALRPGRLLDLHHAPAMLRATLRSVRVCDMTVPTLRADARQGEGEVVWTCVPILYHMRTDAGDTDSSSSSSGEAEAEEDEEDRATGTTSHNEEELHLPHQLNGCENLFQRGHSGKPTTTTTTKKQKTKAAAAPPPPSLPFMRLDAPGGGGAAPEADGELPSCTVLELPHRRLDGLWESLYYGESDAASAAFKRDLVQYLYTALHFSLAGVDAHCVTWNRLLLFYGPPGTGKTSLCKGLAQKLAIRMQHGPFPHTRLVEINAHSLFSRWFSESGKQVMQLFETIRRMAADRHTLVCVLIDEVESLAAARQSAMKGNEPSDAIRVVNALLTQIDRLQRYRNVIVMATSNMTGAIDVAFIDRADKKVHVGPPGREARRAVLQRSVMELLAKDLVRVPPATSTAHTATTTTTTTTNRMNPPHPNTHAEGADAATLALQQALTQLDELAALSEGLNGRTLKKIPFLAYGYCANLMSAYVMEGPAASAAAAAASKHNHSWAVPSLETYMYALRAATVQEMASQRQVRGE